MLKEKIARHQTDVYLVNTGWSGGPYGIGKRININYTRAIVRAAIKGHLHSVEYDQEPFFNLMIPGMPRGPLDILVAGKIPGKTGRPFKNRPPGWQVFLRTIIHNWSLRQLK